MIGTKLDHYMIEKKIGEGGMSEVYLANDTRLLRPVAIKVLSTNLLKDDEKRLGFMREARAASSLNHPNICTVYDVGHKKGVNYIVMEYVDGKTLRQLLDERNCLPEAEVINLSFRICSALAAAHDKGIIHRDIKPENIMITREGYVKIMDFGLAKLASDTIESDSEVEKKIQEDSEIFFTKDTLALTSIMGTVSYMSPEQALGKTLDSRTDIFSFGIVLYEALTGKLPFQAKSNITTLSKIIEDEPANVQLENKNISSEMNSLVEKLLKKNVDDRYSSLKHFVNDLKKFEKKISYPKKRSLIFWPLLITVLFVTLIVAFFVLKETNKVEAQPVGYLYDFGFPGKGEGQFDQPAGLAINHRGDLLVVDKNNHRIQAFDLMGNFLYEFGAFGSEDGNFKNPSGIAINSIGNILVTDTFNHRVQVFDSFGKFLFNFGSECTIEIDKRCIDPDGLGPLEVGDGQFDRPFGIAVDQLDNIFVADLFNNRIQVFDHLGNFLFKFGSPCNYIMSSQLYCVDPDGSGPLELGDGQFHNPAGVIVNDLGNIIVSEIYNHRIQIFDSFGRFLNKFGVPGSGEGQFNLPSSITLDSENNIIVMDSGNNRIQVFDPSGGYLCQFGTHGSGEENLDNPSNAIVDHFGNIVISDANNNRIQVLGRPIFTNVISQVGINTSFEGSPFGIFDFNNDDNLDLYIQMKDVPSILYRNNGENKQYSFTDITSSSGLDKVSGENTGASCIDYDNDGFVDIFVTAHGPKILYRNKGNGTFEDVSDIFGVSGIAKASWGTHNAFGDYNNDGYLDLFLSNDTSRAGVLYKNSGPPQWQFVDVTAESNIVFKGWGHGSVFMNYDNDGDQDIYISTYFGSNVFYRNNGNGTFTDVTENVGLTVGDRCRGIVFGDYDNDGDLDLYVTRGVYHTPFSNLLFRNDGPPDWSFTDVTSEAGVGDNGDGVSSVFGDFDNDGDLDIFVCNINNQANVLYRNNDNGTFTNVTKLAGVSNPLSLSLGAFGDHNNDGFLDLYAIAGKEQILYQNKVTSNYWLKIKLTGTKSNRDGFGSRIIITTGDLKQMRYVDGGDLGGGFQCSIPVHFGLGTADNVDRIEVKWPSGIVTILNDVPANQMLTIVEGETQHPIQSL